jgi:predicted nucleic acid-binding protein
LAIDFGNVVNNFTMVTLTPKEYAQILEKAVADGLEEGRTYDALLLAAAIKSGADRIYTTNVRHFQSLADEKVRRTIVAPLTYCASVSRAKPD